MPVDIFLIRNSPSSSLLIPFKVSHLFYSLLACTRAEVLPCDELLNDGDTHCNLLQLSLASEKPSTDFWVDCLATLGLAMSAWLQGKAKVPGWWPEVLLCLHWMDNQVGRDLQDDLIWPFLAKAQSRQDDPAPPVHCTHDPLSVLCDSVERESPSSS